MLQGRNNELITLNDCFDRKESNVIVLFGEQLVGTTSLWREFAKGKDTTYLKAVPASGREQAYLFAKVLNWDGETEFDYSFKSIFESIISATNHNRNEKKLLVISDFHYLIQANSSFLDELNDFINGIRFENRLTVLLVSNRSAWVEDSFVRELLQRNIKFRGFVRVKPLEFLDIVCMMNTEEFDKLLAFYAILGGLQDAYEQFTPGLSLRQNIVGTFLLPGGFYRNYGMDIIKSELREPAVYATILASLAEGRNKLNDLYLHTGFSRAKISVYLKNLTELSIVEKVRSYDTPGAENTKKGVYRIKNPIVKFYFTFLYPHETELALIGEEEFYNTYIKDRIDNYCMEVFPTICEEFLCLANEREYLPIQFTKYGEWVGKTGTVDIIAQDKERQFIFGYCKKERGVLTYDEFIKLVSVTKETHLTPDYFYLFSLDGFDSKTLDELADRENVFLFDRSDLS